MYLNINQNVKGKPNENYAREFMELFCLGPNGARTARRQLQPDRRRRARQGVHRLDVQQHVDERGVRHDQLHAEPLRR